MVKLPDLQVGHCRLLNDEELQMNVGEDERHDQCMVVQWMTNGELHLLQGLIFNSIQDLRLYQIGISIYLENQCYYLFNYYYWIYFFYECWKYLS